MKKIILFTVLSLVAFTSNGCSGSGDEATTISRITLEVDGLTKVFNYITVDSSNPDLIIVHGQIGGSLIEVIEIDIYKGATGTDAISNIIFTQNDVTYYSNIGNSVGTNVQTNDSVERKLKGSFYGNFKTLSNTGKIIDNGSFTVSY